MSATSRALEVFGTPVTLISSRNRKDELRRAITSVFAQTVETKVLVIDEGSTDGTSQMVREEFPRAMLVRNEKALGMVGVRNQGARIALDGGSRLMFSLDDDAEFSSPRVVEQTLAYFDDERVGAVAIPLLNFIDGTTSDPDRFTEVCPGDFTITLAVRAGACAMRTDLFLAMGGYQGHIGYAEESDWGARLLQVGYVTRAGGGIDFVNHYPSSVRDHKRVTRLKAVNNLLFAWNNVPLPALLWHYPGVWVNMVRYGLKLKHFRAAVSGLFQGTWRTLCSLRTRRPVLAKVYRLTRELVARGSLRIDEAEKLMPARKRFEGVIDICGPSVGASAPRGGGAGGSE